jgi:hypothetical protein
MNMNGTGRAKQEMAPSRLAAGPTPMFKNIGLAAKGIAHDNRERKNVLAAIALDAKGP